MIRFWSFSPDNGKILKVFTQEHATVSSAFGKTTLARSVKNGKEQSRFGYKNADLSAAVPGKAITSEDGEKRADLSFEEVKQPVLCDCTWQRREKECQAQRAGFLLAELADIWYVFLAVSERSDIPVLYSWAKLSLRV